MTCFVSHVLCIVIGVQGYRCARANTMGVGLHLFDAFRARLVFDICGLVVKISKHCWLPCCWGVPCQVGIWALISCKVVDCRSYKGEDGCYYCVCLGGGAGEYGVEGSGWGLSRMQSRMILAMNIILAAFAEQDVVLGFCGLLGITEHAPSRQAQGSPPGARYSTVCHQTEVGWGRPAIHEDALSSQICEKAFCLESVGGPRRGGLSPAQRCPTALSISLCCLYGGGGGGALDRREICGTNVMSHPQIDPAAFSPAYQGQGRVVGRCADGPNADTNSDPRSGHRDGCACVPLLAHSADQPLPVSGSRMLLGGRCFGLATTLFALAGPCLSQEQGPFAFLLRHAAFWGPGCLECHTPPRDHTAQFAVGAGPTSGLGAP